MLEVVDMIESKITAVTQENIDARLEKYRQEEARLKELIRLRQMAGLPLGATTPITNIDNSVNNNTNNINMNNNVSNNVDIRQIGVELQKQLNLNAR